MENLSKVLDDARNLIEKISPGDVENDEDEKIFIEVSNLLAENWKNLTDFDSDYSDEAADVLRKLDIEIYRKNKDLHHSTCQVTLLYYVATKNHRNFDRISRWYTGYYTWAAIDGSVRSDLRKDGRRTESIEGIKDTCRLTRLRILTEICYYRANEVLLSVIESEHANDHSKNMAKIGGTYLTESCWQNGWIGEDVVCVPYGPGGYKEAAKEALEAIADKGNVLNPLCKQVAIGVFMGNGVIYCTIRYY